MAWSSASPIGSLPVDRLGRGQTPQSKPSFGEPGQHFACGPPAKSAPCGFWTAAVSGVVPAGSVAESQKNAKTGGKLANPGPVLLSCLTWLEETHIDTHTRTYTKKNPYIYIYLTRQQDKGGFWAPTPVFSGTSVVLGAVLAGKTRTLGQDRHAVACRRGPLHRLLHAVMAARTWDGTHVGNAGTRVAAALMQPTSAPGMHTCTLISMLVFIPCEAPWSKRR